MKTSPEDVLKAQRALSLWSSTKKIAGILVIVTTVLMIVSALIALRNETNTQQAMKAPLFAAIALSFLFVRSDKRVREIEAMLRP